MRLRGWCECGGPLWRREGCRLCWLESDARPPDLSATARQWRGREDVANATEGGAFNLSGVGHLDRVLIGYGTPTEEMAVRYFRDRGAMVLDENSMRARWAHVPKEAFGS